MNRFVVTDQEHAALYSKLREAFLSRHFAIGKYFRTNLFSQDSRLEGVKADDFYGSNKLSKEKQVKARWNRSRATDNPLMTSGQFLSCLAVEDYLGHPQPGRILRSAILTFKSLYKFTGNHFDGYIIRWDPTTTDNWRVSAGVPQISDMFLVNQEGEYIFCNSATDPMHVQLRTREAIVALWGTEEADRYIMSNGDHGDWQWDYFDRYRRWELSMDELVGVMTAYFMVHKLASSLGTRQEVRRQVNNLGDYLAEHSFLLVRPAGGLNARGATGILPALEYPLVRAMKAITGNTYSARHNFMDVMKKAGYAESLGPALALWTAAGIVSQPLIMPLLAGVIVPAGLTPFIPSIMPILGIVGPIAAVPLAVAGAAIPMTAAPMARAYAIYSNRACFDVANEAAAGEVAIAFLLMDNLIPETRFEGWMWGSSFTGGKGPPWSNNFPPFLGLTALDDTDLTVRNAYISWLYERRRHLEIEPDDKTRAESCFASAVAVLLGAGEEEEKNLVKKLEERYAQFMGDSQSPGIYGPDIAVEDNLNNEQSFDHAAEKSQPALDYISGLALAWLHAKRRQDSGFPVTTTGFPKVPTNIGSWPEPAVPPEVVEAAKLDKSDPNYIAVPLYEIQGKPLPRVDLAGAPLFDTQNAPPKSPIPKPILPPRQSELVYDKKIKVRKSDKDVDTGIVLQDGDEYEISATGKISSGIVFSDENGPNGWANVEYDTNFPLHGALDPINAHPFCLLGRLGGYFFVGEKRSREHFFYHRECPLRLRINDHTPGRGSGAFQVQIRVWGKPRELIERRISCITISTTRTKGRVSRRISHVGGRHPGGWGWRMTISEVIDLIESGEKFYVEEPEGNRIKVIIGAKQSSSQAAYLRTAGDKGKANNLRSLPSCEA